MTRSPSLNGFYLTALGATFMAMTVILIMNLSTPFEFSRDRISELFSPGWHVHLVLRLGTLILVTALASLLLVSVMAYALEPVRSFLAQNQRDALRRKAGQRLINLPFIMIPVNMGLWLVIPGLVFLAFYHGNFMGPVTAATFYIRSVMVGMMSSAILFFSLEAHSRKTFFPILFPEGNLADTDRVRRVSIERRIRAFYRLGSLIPLAHIVLTLFVLFLQVDVNPMSTRDYARSVLFFSIVVFLVFFLGSGILTRLISRSIAEPVNQMVQTVNAVKRGDYHARVQVVSNDEIGVLGDAFNRAIQGLADRQRIRDAFGRYVDPRIRDEILSGQIPLDGQYKEVTILFADLRHFTPLTATRDPKQVVAMLNDYFKTMARAIETHSGLILQFLGDEIYAVFGAPVDDDRHPAHGIQAAFEMDKQLAVLNRDFLSRGLPALSHGIGIHTGSVVAANIGSPDRLSYLLVGDAVNLAARLQSLTRDLDARIIVSRETMDRLPEEFDTGGLTAHPEPVRAKGIDRPLTVFTLPLHTPEAGM